MNQEKYYKSAKEPIDFTDLVSDVALRKKVQGIDFKDESDKRCVDRICAQKGLSEAQRNWFNSLISKYERK